MNWPTDYVNKVLQGNCLEVMKQMPDNSVDSIVTDPPFNATKGIGKYHRFYAGGPELKTEILIDKLKKG